MGTLNNEVEELLADAWRRRAEQLEATLLARGYEVLAHAGKHLQEGMARANSAIADHGDVIDLIRVTSELARAERLLAILAAAMGRLLASHNPDAERALSLPVRKYVDRERLETILTELLKPMTDAERAGLKAVRALPDLSSDEAAADQAREFNASLLAIAYLLDVGGLTVEQRSMLAAGFARARDERKAPTPNAPGNGEVH